MSRITGRKKRRLYIVCLGLLCIGVATALVLTAFEDSIVFFYSPTDIAVGGQTLLRNVGRRVEEHDAVLKGGQHQRGRHAYAE